MPIPYHLNPAFQKVQKTHAAEKPGYNLMHRHLELVTENSQKRHPKLVTENSQKAPVRSHCPIITTRYPFSPSNICSYAARCPIGTLQESRAKISGGVQPTFVVAKVRGHPPRPAFGQEWRDSLRAGGWGGWWWRCRRGICYVFIL